MLWRFGKELFWTAFWVFLVLIGGFALLNWLRSTSLPVLSTASGWVETHASPGGA